MGFFDIDLPSRAVSTPMTSVYSALTSSPPVSRDRTAILKAYSENPQVARCVRFVAQSISAVRWRAFRAPRGQRALDVIRRLHQPTTDRRAILATMPDEIVVHPALDVLLRLSGGQLTDAMVRAVGQTDIELVGECFLRIVRDALGAPSSLLIVNPTEVEKLPTISDPMWTVRSSGRAERIPADQIVFIKDVDPSDPYGRGIGIVGALAQELDADEQAAETLRSRFKNKGLPEVLIEIVGSNRQGTPTEIAEAIERHFWGKTTSGQGAHFIGREIKVHQLGSKLVDMDLVALRSDFRRVVRELIGIPPELLGQVENSNRATIETALEIWATQGMIPRLNRWELAYADVLSRIGGDDIVYVYDSPIPSDAEAQRQIAVSSAWALTRDEIRQAGGFEPTKDGVGSLVAVPLGVALEPVSQLVGFSSDIGPSMSTGSEDSEDESEDEDPKGSSADDMEDEGESKEAKTAKAVQSVALNGAQVEAARALIIEAASGALPVESAKAMLITFYGLTREQVDSIVKPLIGFTPTTPEVPAQ